MKNIVKLALCSAAICPLVSSGQSINIVNPDNTVDPFSNLVTALYSDVETLYVDSPFANFSFTLNSPTTGVFTRPGALGLGDYYFELAGAAPGPFTLMGDQWAKIGYFGNESWDVNTLSVKDDTDTVTNLFTYDVDGGVAPTVGPPQVATLTVNPQFTSASFHFEHTNPIAGTTDQSNTARFHWFRTFDSAGDLVPNVWIIGIDDRENDLIDYDDGFFLLQVVPEPSQIAAMAVLGLGALLLVRRRFKSKK